MADEMAILSVSVKGLTELIRIYVVHTYDLKYNHTISVKKSKLMVFRSSGRVSSSKALCTFKCLAYIVTTDLFS